MKPLHILHVNYEFPPIIGGGSRLAHLLCRELVRRRHRVTMVTSEVEGEPRHGELDGVEVVRCPVIKPWARSGHCSWQSLVTFPLSALRWIRGQRGALASVDVVNAWFALPTGVLSPRMARALERPGVLTLCGGDVYDPVKRLSPHRHWLTGRLVRHALSKHQAVTAISSDLAERVRRDLGHAGEVRVIPVGPDLAGVEPAPFREEPECLRLTSVCRLIPRKGLGAVIEALARLKDRSFSYHIIGDGPLRDALGRQCGRLGIEDRVVFEGSVSEERKRELLSASDAFVLCSFHEGLCHAIAEAMAFGLPVVTGDAGGQLDLVREGEGGLTVRAGDAGSIAGALTRLFDEPELRQHLREANLVKAEKIRIENSAARYEELYLSVVT